MNHKHKLYQEDPQLLPVQAFDNELMKLNELISIKFLYMLLTKPGQGRKE